MSNVFTLASLDEELENTYAPFKFHAGDEEFVLVSLLRVDKKVREQVLAKMESINEQDANDASFDEDKTVEALQFVLSSVTRDRKGARLVKAVGPNLLRLMTLLKHWQVATQPGEASDSSS